MPSKSCSVSQCPEQAQQEKGILVASQNVQFFPANCLGAASCAWGLALSTNGPAALSEGCVAKGVWHLKEQEPLQIEIKIDPKRKQE